MNKNKILEIAKQNNGYITTELITKQGIAKMFLTQLVRENQLIRINRGLYMLSNYIEDEYLKYQSSNPNAIYSLETALYFHNLSDRIPIILDMFVQNNYAGSLMKNDNIRLTYINKELLNLGLIEIESPMGQKIKTYDIDKTICDIIKYKSKIDIEIYSNALKKYAKLKNKNITKLMKYAKEMKIEEKIRDIMEVLL